MVKYEVTLGYETLHPMIYYSLQKARAKAKELSIDVKKKVYILNRTTKPYYTVGFFEGGKYYSVNTKQSNLTYFRGI